MNCTEIQLRISSCLDGEIHPTEKIGFQEHLSRCKDCGQIYADLKVIKETAAALEEYEPRASLWPAISSQLTAEGIVKERRPPLWERVFQGFSHGLKPALAAAMLALFIAGMVYFVRNPGRERVSVSSETAVLLEVQKAELQYQKAIEALNEVSQKRLQSFSPELAQIFVDNLATMDYYLKECKDAAKNNPDNPLVHRYLLVAYEKKAELMQTIVNSDSEY